MCLSIGTTSKCQFSSRLPSGSPKIGTVVVPKLWTPISLSNEGYFENMKATSYSLQKTIFPMVYSAPIKPHLTPAFKGLVVRGQILNLTTTLSFDHNSCKSGLNEQCKGTLSIYTSRPF